jgi:citrate lyase subunit beta/citryl-CoA lyase
MIKENLLLRTMLFVPANNPKHIEKAVNSAADALIFDFEDAIPADKKLEARKILRGYIEQGVFAGRKAFIRPNSLDSPELIQDIQCGIHKDILGFVPPKITSRDDIIFLEKLLTQMENTYNIENGHFKLAPLVETTGAVLNLSDILRDNKRIVAICFGGDDFLNDLHGQHGIPPIAHKTPKSLIAMAARSVGITPIDTPFLFLNDLEGLKVEKKEAFELGFGGALIINPRHIDIVNEAFTPDVETTKKAEAIMKAIAVSKATGAGCVMLGERMVGPPMLRRSEHTIALMDLVKEQSR